MPLIYYIDSEETELQFAESVLIPAANNYYKMNNINISAIPEDRLFSTCDQDDYFLQFLIGTDNECADILRDLIGKFQVNQNYLVVNGLYMPNNLLRKI